MSKIEPFTGGHVSETEQEGCHYEGRVYKSKEASFILGSVRKAFVFLTQGYGSKVALSFSFQ